MLEDESPVLAADHDFVTVDPQGSPQPPQSAAPPAGQQEQSQDQPGESLQEEDVDPSASTLPPQQQQQPQTERRQVATNAPPPAAVWISDKSAVWRRADVLRVDRDRNEYHVRPISTHGETIGGSDAVVVAISEVHPVDPSHLLDLDNCCYMNNMHEAPLLDLLKRRYMGDAAAAEGGAAGGEMKIYTHSGDVVISLNPYCSIAGLYERPERFLTLEELIAQIESVAEAMQTSAAAARRSSVKRLLKGSVECDVDSSTAGTGDAAADELAMRTLCHSPHVYNCANRSLVALLEASVPQLASLADVKDTIAGGDAQSTGGAAVARRNQSIIISGESGAGKTEASKHVMNFLMAANACIEEAADEAAAAAASSSTSAAASAPAHDQSLVQLQLQRSLDVLLRMERSARRSRVADRGGQQCDRRHHRLQQLLLHSSVVLEAFGNAKTVRNDNSSRFGKYIKLLYSPKRCGGGDGSGGGGFGGGAADEGSVAGVMSLTSAATDTFLLEKSRLVNVAAGERNYHIFYQLIHGLSAHDASLFRRLQLKSEPECFQGLVSLGSALSSNGPGDDAAEFSATLQALQTIRCSAAETENTWAMLSCLLHLMNVDCSSGADDGGEESSDLVQLRCDTMPVAGIAELLGVEHHEMIRCFRTQVMKVMNRASINVKILSAPDVRNNIFALVKWIYSRLFDWLVRKMNYAHIAGGCDESTAAGTAHASSGGPGDRKAFIGILDIFGFEILYTNSFEQLCINFTNERLQQQFNEYVFITEQQMYSAEGLQWDNITFKDNQHVIDLIGGVRRPEQPQGGLLLILEEHGLLNRAPDDTALLNQYNKVFGGGPAATAATAAAADSRNRQLLREEAKTASCSDAFARSKFGNDSFVVKHFAGVVEYHIDGFLSKNNDSLQEDLMQLLQTSSNLFLRNVLGVGPADDSGPGYIASAANPAAANEHGAGGEQAQAQPAPPLQRRGAGKKMASAATVSQKFRVQLDELMKTLRGTRPHYVKCIKPNSLKRAREFDAELVTQQLRYSGVMEVVRIRREGFPIRVPFQQFYRNYEIFAIGKSKEIFPGPEKCSSDEQLRDCCVRIAHVALQPHQFQVGHSMVFLRDDGLEQLQLSMKRFLGRRAAKLQAKVRGLKAKRRFLSQRSRVIVCQSFLRMAAQRSRFIRMREAAMKIQWLIAGKRLREEFKRRYAQIVENRRHAAATRIQSIHRALQAIVIFRTLKAQQEQRRLAAALRIQPVIRMFTGKRRAQTLRLTKVRLQCALAALHRGSVARRWFRTVLLAVARIQSLLRMRRARSDFQSQLIGIITVQSAWRRKLAFRTAAYVRAIITVQSVVRRWRARRIVSELSAIVFVQSCARGFLARRFVRGLRALMRLQSIVRMRRAMKELDRQRKARRIQREVRGWIVYRRYKEQQYAVICVQSFVRMRLAMHRRLAQMGALVTLQSFVRVIVAKRRFRLMMKSILHMQRAVRGRLARVQFEDKIVAIIVLQSFIRRVIAQQHFGDSMFATVVLQAAIRMVVCRRSYVRIRKSIIKLQSQARTYIAKQRFEEQIYSVIIMQSFVRKAIAQRRYDEIFFAVIAIQAVIRSALARRKFLRTYAAVIKVQAITRGRIARIDFDRKFIAVVTLQAFRRMIAAHSRYMLQIICILLIQSYARMIAPRRRYLQMRAAAIRIQCMVRCCRARRELLRRRAAVLKVQSFMRMASARRHLIICLASVISIQSHVRAFLHQSRYLFFTFAVLVLQSHIRRFCKSRQWRRLRSAAVITARYFRGYAARKRYQTLVHSIEVLGRAIAAYRRFILTRRGSLLLHHGLRGRKQFEGVQLVDSIMHYVQMTLARDPLEKSVRCRWFRYCTVFHSTILGGDIRILKLLNPTFKDVLAIDADRRNSAHYIAMNPVFANLRFFASALSDYKHRVDVVLHALLDDDEEESSDKAQQQQQQQGQQVQSISGGDDRHTELRRALSTSVGRDTLLSGWIKKKRGGLMWQRRWAVLTEDYIIYYKNPESMNAPKFAIPLVGISVHRLAGKEPVLEITSPTMASKKSFFGTSNKKSILFLMDSEMELQEWLIPLKALAGIGSLRRAGSTSSPVKYVNTRLRELWVGAVDCEGNTALHVAAMLVERSEKGGNEEAARLACWLLENGLNVNTQNVHGETALHICMKAARGQRGRMLIRCLAMKGADAQNIIDEDGNNVVAVLLANRSLEQEMKNHYLQLLESARRGSPSSSFQDIHLQASSSSGKACGGGSTGDNSLMKVQKLKGYSYLSFFIGRLLILDARAAAWDRPRLSFSVYNSKGQVLEEMCTLRHPIVSSVDKLQWPDENGPTSPSSSSDRRGSNSTLQRRGSESSTPKRNLDYLDLWWGTSWHMRTPLENIEEGSFVLIQLQQELSDSTSGSSKGGAAVDAYANDEPVYWTRFVIDVDTIQTSEEDLLPLNFMESCASLLNVPAASRISQRAPPLFLTAAVLPPVQPTSVGATSGGGNRSQQYVTATMSHLTVDCVLHQLDRKVDISSVMKA